MYQDPSTGKIKIYYVVTKIIHIKSTEKEVRNSKLKWRLLLIEKWEKKLTVSDKTCMLRRFGMSENFGNENRSQHLFLPLPLI